MAASLLSATMRPLTDHDLSTLAAELSAAGFRPSHARRILREFYEADGRPEFRPEQVGRELVDWLGRAVPLRLSRVAGRSTSGDGTTKLLASFGAGGAAECVLMPAHRPDRAAGCVSSQIGCAMRCDFCASTKGVLERDLTAGEIAEQYLHLKFEAARA